jgi:hypothetical protein
MLLMLQVFQRRIASVCSNCFIICCNRFLSGYCIYFTHMLQYVLNISVVFSLMLQQVVLCCKLQFEYFMCFTNMLQVHVPNISSIFHTYIAFKCFHVASVLYCSART